MKFLADMPVSPKTVEFLRSVGYDAIRLNDLGMQGVGDEEIIEYAAQHNYVIVTMDLDFGGYLAQKGLMKPSVITFRFEIPEVTRINRMLKEELQQIEQDLDKGAIVIFEDFRIRVRRLPI